MARSCRYPPRGRPGLSLAPADSAPRYCSLAGSARRGPRHLGPDTLTSSRAIATVGSMAPVEIRTRRWTRVEYERLVEAGFFRPGDPIELVGGQLIVAEPQGSRHFAAVSASEEALRTAFGAGWEVRAQGPLALDDDSEPEPDLAVVAGSFRDFVGAHPSRPVLVIEVSESSLALDREHKGSLYARAALADYWIVNLLDQVLEVYRE